MISAKSHQDVSTDTVPNLWSAFVIKDTAALFVIALFVEMDAIILQACTSSMILGFRYDNFDLRLVHETQ